MKTTTVVIGAGQSGLAMSRRLTERSIDHVVLERGEVAHSWAKERWDSLRLLTPNWQNRLPGQPYAGNDPDGFLSAHEVADFLGDYAKTIAAPVHTGTTVTHVSATDDGYEVQTDRGTWTCETVVIASGACNIGNVPAVGAALSPDIRSLTALDYRSADDLDDRGVLVVGASATGVQIADELARSGRKVTISVGEHVRMPRSYRGKDIFWWMDAAGVLDEGFDQFDDLVRTRHVPSPQLIGSPEHRTINLNTLRDNGISVVGRLGRLQDDVAQFSGGLANTCQLADFKLGRLLDRFDEWASESGADGLDASERYEPTRVDPLPRLELGLNRDDIGTVFWATGYRPDYSWLDVPVFGYKGSIKHDGGVVTDAPGMYLLGTSLLRRRRSTYINGAESDTRDIAEHLQGYLAGAQLRAIEDLPTAV
ncbi:MAG: NAD(P)-binding domain-containing protein [Lacisediminihabitans sp.]